MLAITSISISRVMLSIRSLAANFGSDEAWLLNNVELSRVRWKKGAHDGEIIVDVQPVEGDELVLPSVNGPRSQKCGVLTVRTTCVGVMDDPERVPLSPGPSWS